MQSVEIFVKELSGAWAGYINSGGRPEHGAFIIRKELIESLLSLGLPTGYEHLQSIPCYACTNAPKDSVFVADLGKNYFSPAVPLESVFVPVEEQALAPASSEVQPAPQTKKTPSARAKASKK